MRIDTSDTLTLDEIRAITTPVLRFERKRSVPALVILGGMAVIAALAMPGLPAATGIAAFLVMAGLALTWEIRAQRASAATRGFEGAYRLLITNNGLTADGPAAHGEVPWEAVTHATKTNSGWLVVSNKGKVAIPVPTRLLSDAQIGALHQRFAGWPMRRYRRAPW